MTTVLVVDDEPIVRDVVGLAIARGLVEAQGGRIWAEPVATGGARVSFTLPR